MTALLDDLAFKITELKNEFLHFAVSDPWICLTVRMPHQRQIVFPSGEKSLSFYGVRTPRDAIRRAAAYHVDLLTGQAGVLLVRAVKKHSQIGSAREIIEAEQQISGAGWVRWLLEAVQSLLVPLEYPHPFVYYTPERLAAVGLTPDDLQPDWASRPNVLRFLKAQGLTIEDLQPVFRFENYPQVAAIALTHLLENCRLTSLSVDGPNGNVGKQISPSAPRKLSESEKKIISLCRRCAMKGETIAKHPQVGLSYDYCRHVLARLMKERRLKITEKGYRSV